MSIRVLYIIFNKNLLLFTVWSVKIRKVLEVSVKNAVKQKQKESPKK